MPDHASHQSGASKESLLDRVIDKFKPQPAPPPQPHAPSVKGNHAWEESVEQHHVVPGLTVRDVGLSVYGETKSLSDRPGSNEHIGVARQKIAHAMINDAELSHHTGKHRNKVHDPVEPKTHELHNPDERAALESSMQAAREAYLSGHDPTQGATHFNMRPAPNRSPWKSVFPISTQSGPYDNSFPNKSAPDTPPG
jgi:hypothetical protein